MRRMGLALLMTVGWLLATALTIVTYERFSDGTSLALLQWGLFYVWTLLLPGFWYLHLTRRLRKLAATAGNSAAGHIVAGHGSVATLLWWPISHGFLCLLLGLQLVRAVAH